MCGRYENAADNEELKKEFEKHIGELDIAYNIEEVLYTENIAPTDRVKIITFDNKDNVFRLKTIKWGIKTKVFDQTRQAKGKDPYFDKDVFNSKIETIKVKGSKWMEYMKNNRCIFPMTAFYEWTGEKGSKIPQRITIDDSKIFFAGGIIAKGTDNTESASIITCEPNTFMKPIHNRMPVLLKTKEAGEFLRAREDAAGSMSVPLDEGIKMYYEKTVLVKNTPQNDLFRL